MPTSLAAPGICDREFISGFNVKPASLEGRSRRGVGGREGSTHIHIMTLALHKVVSASAYFTISFFISAVHEEKVTQSKKAY